MCFNWHFDFITIRLERFENVFSVHNLCVNVSYFLFVSEPVTEILGGPDLFINMGSTINLTCLVRFAPEPPPSMLWAHNAHVINFDSPRGGISLVTEKGQVTTSRLLIQKAVQTDSGLYTCTPSNANSASVRVHILNGNFVLIIIIKYYFYRI